MAACLSVLLLGVWAHWEGGRSHEESNRTNPLQASRPLSANPLQASRPLSLALDMPSRPCMCVCACVHMGVSTAVRAELGLTVRSRHSLLGTESSGPTEVPGWGKGWLGHL